MFNARFFVPLCFFTLFFVSVYAAVGDAETVPPEPVVFYSDLTYGMSSSDVRSLQKILNSNPATLVTPLGPGSPGNETIYFGNATRAAVIRFQEKYSAEILLPAGLTGGTGYVGPLTRAALNRFSLGLSNIDSGEPTEPVSFLDDPEGILSLVKNLSALNKDNSVSKEIHLSYPSEYSGRAGSKLILFGSGFSSANTIDFGSFSIKNIGAISPEAILFTIPTNAPPGRYDISISNEKGKAPEKTFFVVTSPGVGAPEISKIEPSLGKIGGSVKIIGKNFSLTGNEVRSNLGIFSSPPSPDGTTITFTPKFSNENEMQTSFDQVSGLELKMNFYIVNGNGLSGKNSPGIYTVTK